MGACSESYYYNETKLGDVYITEGTTLDGIGKKYDCILSSNNLEHIANPIKALLTWKQKLNCKGLILIIVPNKEYSFDHNREYTSFEHLLQDYQEDVTEYDLTHLEEILKKHDLTIDVRAGDFDSFKKRSLNNYYNRCLHHHVFNTETLKAMFEFCFLDILKYGKFGECYFILGQNTFQKR